jgi:hypothetical protein
VSPHALCLLGLLAAAGPAADPRVSAREVLERGYQTDLPAGSPRPRSAESSSSTHDPRPSLPRPPAGPSLSLPAFPVPLSAILWLLFAGALVAGLVWAVRQAGRARRGEDAEAPPADAPAPPPRRALRIGPLTDVEELARQGRFGEAIHLLLMHLFAALQRRPTTAPAPAQTNREVLARTRLAGEARAALGVLVSAAEMVHFGGREAAREDYENCLGHYRRFLDAFERTA